MLFYECCLQSAWLQNWRGWQLVANDAHLLRALVTRAEMKVSQSPTDSRARCKAQMLELRSFNSDTELSMVLENVPLMQNSRNPARDSTDSGSAGGRLGSYASWAGPFPCVSEGFKILCCYRVCFFRLGLRTDGPVQLVAGRTRR